MASCLACSASSSCSSRKKIGRYAWFVSRRIATVCRQDLMRASFCDCGLCGLGNLVALTNESRIGAWRLADCRGEDNAAAGGATGTSSSCACLFRSRAIGRALLSVLTVDQAGYNDLIGAGNLSGGAVITIKPRGPHGLARRAGKRLARSNNVDNQWVGKTMVQTLPQKRGKRITVKKKKYKKFENPYFPICSETKKLNNKTSLCL